MQLWLRKLEAGIMYELPTLPNTILPMVLHDLSSIFIFLFLTINHYISNQRRKYP